MRALVAAALVVLLQACASVQETSGGAYLAPEQPHWSVQGKFSFQGPEGRETGQFYWTQAEDNYHLRLVGPLGVGGAEVERLDRQVVIRSRGEVYQGNDTALMLYELTGIWIPVEQLPDLLRGRGAGLHSDWQVQYQGALEIAPYLLPERLTLISDQYRLQIFISQWSI